LKLERKTDILKQESTKNGDLLNLKAKEHFSKEDIQMASKDMKRNPTSLVISDMPMKTRIGYYFSPVKMGIIFKKILMFVETGTLVYCWWECKMV
jgi:hypothetical protein